MLRGLSKFLATVLCLLPATLLAGGPPRLCLPVDGAAKQDAGAVAKLLATALKDKVWEYAEEEQTQIQEYRNQHYLAFPMGKDVALSDIEAALAGAKYTVPVSKLRLFGHVTLEIDPGKAPADKILADLEAVPLVCVAESKTDKGRLLVTIDMPYPVSEGSIDRETVGWDTFQWNGLSSDQAPRSEPPAKAASLPSYETLKKVVARHNASLKDIRWSTQFACRALGGVAVEDPGASTSATRAPR